MFLDGLIHRKIAALLRPWLVQEPQWEVKLGFMSSLVVARNLRFNVSALDLGTHLFLKDVMVEELRVRFDPWSVPAFDVDVRGVHVTLSTKELVSDQMAKSSDTSLREKKKILSRIDPEGTAIYGNLEKLMNCSSSSASWRSSFLNLILTKCCLRIHDIHIRIEFPFSDEACAFLWDVVELNVQCQNKKNRSLVRDFIGVFFLPLRESSFEIAASGMDLAISRKDDVRCLLSSKEPCIDICLKDLCVLDFMLRAPEVNLAVSPSEVSLLAAFATLIAVEPKQNRNGQQLWECVRKKVYTFIRPCRYLLYQVIDIVVISLRLVKAYQQLLVLIGCSVDKASQRMVIGMSRGRNFPQSAIKEWTLISEIEKKLHAEAIAWARRVARSRVISEAQVAAKSITASGQFVREDSTHLFSFTLNLAKISVVVSPADVINLSANQGTRISYMNLLSFCLVIRELVFVCEDSIFQQYVSFSMGKLAVTSASDISGISNAASSGKASASIEDSQREAVETKTIIRAEPAEIFARPGEIEANSDRDTDIAAIIALKKLLGEFQLTWTKLCTRFEQADMLYSRNPFVICDITSFWLFPGLKSPDLGLWKCCLGVGKLNFALGCSEILSITVLMRQMLWNFREADRLGGTVAHAHSSWTSQDIQEINYHSRSISNIKDLKMTLCKLLPDRPVELAAVIAGPHVHVSPRAEEHMGNEYSYDLILDVHSTDLAVWPATDSGHPRLDDMGAENFKWDGYRVNALPEPDNIAFISHGNISLGYYLSFGGLNADFMDSKENQQMQILLLKPVTVILSSLRDYLHSFAEITVASTAMLSGLIKGGVVIFCVEELSVFFQVFEGLFSQVKIYTSGYSDLNDDKDHVAYIKHEIVGVTSEIEDITVQYGHGTELDSLATCVITCTLEVDPFSIIIHGSIKGYDRDNSFRSGDSMCSNLGLIKFPEFGIWLSTYNMLGEITCLEDKLELHADFSGFRGAIFKYKIQIQNFIGQLEDESGFLNFMDCLYETSLSSSTLTYFLDCLEETLPSEVNEVAEKEVASSSSTVSTTNYLLLKVTFNEFFVGRSSIKNLLSDTYLPDTLLSFSAGKDFKTVCLELQDGLVYIDPTALAAFDCCLKSYLQCIKNLELPYGIKNRAEPCEVISNHHQIEGTTENSSNADNLFSWKDGEDLTINLNQVSIILLSTNESGEVQEIIGIVDLSFNLRPKYRRKFSFSISQLKIHSQILKLNVESLVKKNTSRLADDDSSERLQHIEMKNPTSADAGCSASTSAEKPTESDSVCCVVQETENHILKGLSAFVSAEKLEIRDDNDCLNTDQGWAGSGSVSGLDITISLSEIKMFIDCIESLSEIFTKESSSRSVTERLLPSANIQPEQKAEGSFLDGAIVAIQDVHQKMYVAVQHEETKFYLGGTTHYSLVGGKALFRVRSQKQRIWNFQTSWFSLASLYAKNDKGEPLLLSCCSKSGFVDISTPNNSNDALWKVVSCKAECHDGDTYLEPYYHLSKNTCYLVNKRNGCGVAFVDGVPEFVNKPGNPFKFKLFRPSSSACGPARSDNPPVGVDGSNLGDLESQNPYEQALVIPRIIFAVDNISLTIVDELSDSDDKFPLVKGCLDSIEVVVQILPYKARVMSTLIATLSYFDAHNIQWRKLVHPCQTYMFYRKRFSSQDALTCFHKVPGLLCLGVNRMDVSFTELSLDILLYVIGKLDLAGPFAVNSSTIMANRCKVENQLRVNLLCQFNDSQDSRVGSKQSAVLFIRHTVNQPLSEPYISIKLETLGTFSTSSIQLPLSESHTYAWRTCIASLQDARTYPGPVIVVDISKNVEEGLSVAVSPLLRIHNETKFSLELSFERPQQAEPESASLFLKSKDTIDDCIAAFEAINLSGGEKKALTSLSVGNFLFSFRPDSKEILSNSNYSISVGWSDKIQGGKAIRLSGIMDKLGYKVRKALNDQSSICSFSLASCSVTTGDSHLATMHFLVQSIIRDVPVMKPNNGAESRSSTVTFLQQREIFILPTVRIYNLLQLDVHVLLIESDKSKHSENIGASDKSKQSENIGNQATVPRGSTADLYANPAVMCFTITLVDFPSSCKPVKSNDWIKKLNKQKDGIQFLDIDLEFCGGKYFASLRLTRDDRGILEAVIFTQYTLKNDTGFYLFCSLLNQMPPSRDEFQENSTIPSPDLGSILPPQSSRSWFMKSNILCVTLLPEKTSQVLNSDKLGETLDLDSLSGLTELSLVKRLELKQQLLKLGVSLGPLGSTISAPAQVVSMIPRYVVSNDSNEKIFVQQCGYEDDLEGIMSINSKHKAALLLVDVPSQRRKVGILDKLLWKHRADNDSSSLLVQFRMDSTGFGWSGPVCVASLGRFFLKFKTSSESPVDQANISKQMEHVSWDFAAVNVVEEASSLVLHFSKLPVTDLPYRIENHLSFASITHYQKDVFESHSLPPGISVYYAWDDVTHPHKLVVRVDGYNISHEISLDKLRPWKPFSRSWQLKETNGMDVGKIGYEVYADGPTRVLRLSYSQDGPKKGVVTQKHMKIQLRFSGFDVQLFEQREQDIVKEKDPADLSVYSPIIFGRLENICLDSLFSDQQKYHQIRLRSINVDAKWSAAPFSSLLHGHQLSTGSEGNILFIVIVLNPSVSNVTQVKYSSILLQPVTINLDEETLLKIVPFWRKSLSQSTQSRQYYFDHFEIHPIKIIASFLPEESYSGYNSAQEALRTLLHSVIKIPTVKNAVVELNGVLVTHALVTTRELLIRCAQHYSWYAMRAIYIVKGSPLLPPSFTSVFDDLASSSLDVFFDPSSSLLNVRGLTMGTFKLMSKYIKGKGFSGTKRYFGDLEKTLRTAGSNVLFTAVTEISDSVLKGAESSGFNGMVTGFHQGILKLAMEPALLGTAFMEGGPDRKIVLDQSPGVDVPYIEGYLQAMLDALYKQEYLRVKVNDNEVILKNLPPSSSLINEIVDRVRDFLISKALLKGDSSTRTRPFRHILRGENEWKIGPTILTLCEHLFVSFTIRMLRKQTGDVLVKIKPERVVGDPQDKGNIFWRWGFGKFVMSAMLAYVDGRLCRCIPNPIARRIVSGFLLSFLDKREGD